MAQNTPEEHLKDKDIETYLKRFVDDSMLSTSGSFLDYNQELFFTLPIPTSTGTSRSSFQLNLLFVCTTVMLSMLVLISLLLCLLKVIVQKLLQVF